MVAGVELARFLGMRPGDELGLPSADPRAKPMKLVGTFDSRLDLWTADVVLCDEDDARALLGVPDGEAIDVAVTLDNPQEARIVELFGFGAQRGRIFFQPPFIWLSEYYSRWPIRTETKRRSQTGDIRAKM